MPTGQVEAEVLLEPVRRFIGQFLLLELPYDRTWMACDTLYRAYVRWGEGPAMDPQTFGRAFRKSAVTLLWGPLPRRRRREGRIRRGYAGVWPIDPGHMIWADDEPRQVSAPEK